MKKLIIAFVAALIAISPAHADFTAKNADGNEFTFFAFSCFTVKTCTAHVVVNSAGTEIFTSSNPAQVTGENGTFPATQSGTWTVQSAQSGTWTVQPGNTANSTAWLVTGAGGTFPATQSGNWAVRAQDGSGNALTSATLGSERALSVQILDGSGNQITSFGGAGGTASNFGSAVPSSGTAAGFSDGTNMQAARAFDADSGAGSQYVLGAILRKSASGGSVEAGTSSDPWFVTPKGFQDSGGTDMTDTTNHALKVVGVGSGDGDTSSGISGSKIQAQVNTAVQDYTSQDGKLQPVSLSTFGALRVQPTAPATTVMQNGATANGNGTALNVLGFESATLNIICSVSCSGGTTINFEASVDDTTFVAITGWQKGTAAAGVTSVTAGGDYTFNVAGYKSLRARISAYSAGTITVKGYQTSAGINRGTADANLFIGGSSVDGNSGNKSAQTLRVVLATDQPSLTNAQPGNVTQLGGTAIATNSGNKDGGTQRVVLATDQPALSTPLPTNLQAGTTGGCTPGKVDSAASTNATSVKGSAGTLCKLVAVNTTATLYWLKTYNTASAPTCNSDTVVGKYPIPPSNGGIAVPLGAYGEAYSTGIGFCLTGAQADNDNTSAATGVAISYASK